MKLSEFTIDVVRAEQGAWVNEVPEMEGLRLKVRSSSNAEFRRTMTKMIEALPRKKKVGGRLDPDESDRITSVCMLKCCLLDWSGLEDGHGKTIPFSQDMATQLLLEPEYRRFRDAVVWAAGMVAETTEDMQEEVAGNLSTLSVGSTSGERKSKVG